MSSSTQEDLNASTWSKRSVRLESDVARRVSTDAGERVAYNHLLRLRAASRSSTWARRHRTHGAILSRVDARVSRYRLPAGYGGDGAADAHPRPASP